MHKLVIFFIIIILFIIIIYSCNIEPKILIGIVTIDRDADLAPQLYSALIENGSKDILVITRDSDYQTINFWKNKATVKTIPHYDIFERHNMNKIAKKRSMVTKYAKKNKYDAIWFVDSDIIPLKGTLSELAKTTKDICIAPYKMKWTGCACVGIESDKYPYVMIHKISDSDKSVIRKPCIIGVFGCTYMKSNTFDIKIEYKKLQKGNISVSGEDIGFFINCNKAGIKCEYLTNCEQPHLYDRHKEN